MCVCFRCVLFYNVDAGDPYRVKICVVDVGVVGYQCFSPAFVFLEVNIPVTVFRVSKVIGIYSF
jgi:hypothetical protein